MIWVKRIIIFMVVFLTYHIGFGCSVFPVSDGNYLLAPDWYPILGVVISAGVSYVFTSRKRRRKLNVEDSTEVKIELPQLDNAKARIELPQLDSAETKIELSIADSAEEKYSECASNKIITKRKMMELTKNPEKKREPVKIDVDEIIRQEQLWRRKQCGLNSIDYDLELIDNMDGYQFEQWCAKLLRKNGYTEVEVTPKSKDQGVDIIAEKDGIHYAIQCKCYSSDLGNSPVQQIYTGKTIYHCQIGVVMTNRHFTAGGKKAAEDTGVLLWDRDKIIEMLESEI